MKRLLLPLFFLICISTKITYSMQEDNLVDNTNDVNQNSPVQDNQTSVELNISLVKNLLKLALNTFATTELINQNVVITSVADTLSGSKKQTIKALLSKLIKEGINTDKVAQTLASEIDCDPKIIAELIDKITQKNADKKNIFRKAIDKLSPESINSLKKMSIGAATAAICWAVGHGLSHETMELLEPETMEYALPFAITAAATTYLLYNSERALSFLRNKLLNLVSSLTVKVVNLDSTIDPFIEKIGQGILDVTPDVLLPNINKCANNDANLEGSSSENLSEGPDQEQESATKFNEISDDYSVKYEDFILSLTPEQKDLLMQDFNNRIKLDIIIKLGKTNPRLLFKAKGFAESLNIEQLQAIAALMPENKETA